jgi:hypothetical protein
MSTTEPILARAAAALAAAANGDERTRLEAITNVMLAFEQLAREVAKGAATWAEARSWAAHHAAQLVAADSALTDWEFEMGEIFYHGGEEDAERALMRRSQHALAREVFRDTAGDALLAAYEAEDVDQDLHEKAVSCLLDAPDWVPHSHTWWRWPEKS